MKELIELSELRIRNILLYKGELHYVSSLSLDIDDEYTDLIGVTPLGKTTGEKQDWNRAMFGDLVRVGLSDELLSRLGYQYANENGQKFYWHTDLPYFQLRKDEDSWGFWYSESDVEALISKKDIEYVHDLQNIHFYLSGEELNVAK